MCLAAMPIVVHVAALGAAWPVVLAAAAAVTGGVGLAIFDAVWFTTLQRLIPRRLLAASPASTGSDRSPSTLTTPASAQ